MRVCVAEDTRRDKKGKFLFQAGILSEDDTDDRRRFFFCFVFFFQQRSSEDSPEPSEEGFFFISGCSRSHACVPARSM